MSDDQVAAKFRAGPIGLHVSWRDKDLVIDVPAVAEDVLNDVFAETPVLLLTAHVPQGIPYRVSLVIKTPNLRFFLRPWPASDGTLSLVARWHEQLCGIWRGDTLLARIVFVTPRGNREFLTAYGVQKIIREQRLVRGDDP